jgi:hypothetical protein
MGKCIRAPRQLSTKAKERAKIRLSAEAEQSHDRELQGEL